jgi:hypothetical protein
VDHPAAFDQIISFDPSLLPAVEPRGLTCGAAAAGHLLHNQNVTRIAFDRNRVLLSGFARELTGYLDRFSCPRDRAVMAMSMLEQDRISNLPPLRGGFVRMIRVLGAAASGVALLLRAIEPKHSRRTYASGRRFSGGAKQNSPLLRRVVERKPRQGCVSCIFKLLERLAPSVHRRRAERSVRLGRCEGALNVEVLLEHSSSFPSERLSRCQQE